MYTLLSSSLSLLLLLGQPGALGAGAGVRRPMCLNESFGPQKQPRGGGISRPAMLNYEEKKE